MSEIDWRVKEEHSAASRKSQRYAQRSSLELYGHAMNAIMVSILKAILGGLSGSIDPSDGKGGLQLGSTIHSDVSGFRESSLDVS